MQIQKDFPAWAFQNMNKQKFEKHNHLLMQRRETTFPDAQESLQ